MRYTGVGIISEPKITGLKNSVSSLRLTESTKEVLKPWKDRSYVLPPDDFSFRNIAPGNDVELTAEMVPQAKVMDFMYFSPYLIPTDIIISQRAVDFLAGQKMIACEFAPVTLQNKGKIIEGKFYIWINHKIRPELLDMEHSIIRSGTKGLGFQFHQVKDIIQYWQLINEVRNTSFIKTKFKDDIIPPDCMRILGGEIFVTDKFWKEYKQAGLIGLGRSRDELELIE